MNKPPAFQFYADDFIAGVADMTQNEVGAYIMLLAHAWNTQGLTSGFPERLKLLAKGDVSAHVLGKFELRNGRLCNPRQELERQKQSEYREKQAINGAKGGRPHSIPKPNPSLSFGLTQTEPKKSSPSPSPYKEVTASPFVIPDNLKSKQFEQIWGKWLEHLKQKRKSPTILAAEMQLKKLSAMGTDRAVKAIEHSITGNYQGIFEPNESKPNGQTTLKRDWSKPDITQSL